MTPTRAVLALMLGMCTIACGFLPPAGGISGGEAATAARDAVPLPEGDEWVVDDVEQGPIEQMMPDRGDYDWARELPADRWVWQVSLESRDRAERARVIIDFVDGTVYGSVFTFVSR